jgi:RimJ/RimL family protein N-acetyltransferase
MITIVRRDDGEVIGDLALRLGWGGRSAEVGYTLSSAFWGCGYATEALDSLVDWLFTNPELTRVHAMLHPDNIASAGVLERTGFLFEGRTRLSYWVGEDNSDDLLYGLTRTDREAWQGRPRHVPADARFVEIDQASYEATTELSTHKSQERLVRPVLISMADALYPEIVDGEPSVPWIRGVEADGELVGVVPMAESTAAHAEPELWRFLIDRLHQRRGIGRRVLDLVVEHCRSRGDDTLLVHWGEGPGSPRPFYEAFGFVPTGAVRQGETEARLTLG